MVKKSIKFEIQTPLMMGGFDELTKPKNEREGNRLIIEKINRHTNLNVNSIKGSMRWWFRALHGWSSNLQKYESGLFGNTDKAAPVKMSLQSNLKSSEWKKAKEDKELKNYGQCGKGHYNGYDYLSYTNRVRQALGPKERNECKVTVRKFYKPGDEFNLNLFGKQEDLEKYLMVLWLLIQFGGLGNRSRRCFGNLLIKTPPPIDVNGKTFSFQNNFKCVSDYKEIIVNNFLILNQVFPNSNSGKNKISTLKDGDLLLSEKCPRSGWKEAINFAGVAMQKFRAYTPPEINRLKEKPLKQNLILKRPAFGLPINFKFSDRKYPSVILNQFDEKNEQARFASPIIASLVIINDNFHVQYLIMSRDFSNLNVKAQRKKTGEEVKINIDTKVVGEFITHLRKFSFKDGSVYKYEPISLIGV